MDLIRFNHREDFGHDFYVQILNIGRSIPKPFKRLSLLQVSVSWNDYPSWPYIQIHSGNGGLLNVIFWVYKFGIDIDVASRTWKFDWLDKKSYEDII